MNQIQKTNPLVKFQDHKDGFQTISFKNDKKRDLSIYYKALIFDFLNLFLSGVFGFYVYRYLNNQNSFWFILVLGILFLTIIIFESALNFNWTRRIIVLFLETILFFYFFLQKEFINIILILAVAFFILRLWGEFQTKRNFENSLEIKFLKFTKPTFSSAVAAILLVAIGFYILNFKDNQVFISQYFFNSFWTIFANVYNKIYPEINLDGSLNDFIRSLVILNFKDQGMGFLKNLSSEEREKILNEATIQTQKEFVKKFNLENADFNQSLKETIYLYLETKLENWYKNLNFYFLIIWAIVLFWIGYGLFLFLKIFLNIWLFIVFEIFLALEIINISGQTKTKEILTF